MPRWRQRQHPSHRDSSPLLLLLLLLLIQVVFCELSELQLRAYE